MSGRAGRPPAGSPPDGVAPGGPEGAAGGATAGSTERERATPQGTRWPAGPGARSLVLAASLGLGGCTLGPGEPWATAEEVVLDARFAPGAARDLGDGSFLTDQGAAVRWERFELTVAGVALEALGGGGGLLDPADPPPGYSNCHNGHCHADDGALVSYAAIEAELAGDAASFATALGFDGPWTLDLVAGTRLVLAEQLGLPLVEVSQLRLDLTRLELALTVDGGPTEVVEGAPTAPLLAGAEWGVTRDSEPTFNLYLNLVPEGTLLDDLTLDPLDPAAVTGAVEHNLVLNLNLKEVP